MNDINLFRAKGSVFLKEVRSKDELGDDCDGYLIRSSEAEARRIIASLKDKKEKKVIALVGGDDALNRRAVETLKIDYLVSPERNAKFDTLKQRDSGLNHVVAKTAREKGIKIVVDVGEIAGLEGKERAERIAKIIQNVKVCRKAKCEIKVASLAKSSKSVFDEKARQSFGVTVGMSSGESSNSVKF